MIPPDGIHPAFRNKYNDPFLYLRLHEERITLLEKQVALLLEQQGLGSQTGIEIEEAVSISPSLRDQVRIP